MSTPTETAEPSTFIADTLAQARKNQETAQAAVEAADKALFQARLNLAAAVGAVRALEYVSKAPDVAS